jgi:hypothetical protein
MNKLLYRLKQRLRSIGRTDQFSAVARARPDTTRDDVVRDPKVRSELHVQREPTSTIAVAPAPPSTQTKRALLSKPRREAAAENSHLIWGPAPATISSLFGDTTPSPAMPPLTPALLEAAPDPTPAGAYPRRGTSLLQVSSIFDPGAERMPSSLLDAAPPFGPPDDSSDRF